MFKPFFSNSHSYKIENSHHEDLDVAERDERAVCRLAQQATRLGKCVEKS